jgi:hypothetical protein
MGRIHCLVATGLLCVLARCVSGADDPLAHLRAEHPRLLVLDDQISAVASAVASDPLARSMHDRMLREADKLLTEAPSVYTIGGPEHTLLSVSRTVEGRVFLLAGLYRLDHDRRFADRAIAEMRAAAGFPDWYPAHFLDTAEMTAALGVGYDWCFDAMSAQDRGVIKQAIIAKGIDPGLARMQAGKSFSRMHNNWVQVCYGGLTLGALAIAEDERPRAAQVIDHSIPAIHQIMKLFNPDGGFEEGPVYWNYATTFNTYYLAALNTALGMDVGWSSKFSYDKTGEYRMQTISPLFEYANFGDCGTKPGYAAQMFWMARQFNRPMYAEHERNLDAHPNLIEKSPGIFELLWQFPLAKPAPTGNTHPDATLATAESFARIHAAFMRTSWTDPNASYVAFKGGDARASHGHLDLGQFICEMAGQRWAVDLGSDSYGLPGYFGRQRFSYYRLGTDGHNTLTIGSSNQSKKAVAALTLSRLANNASFAVTDLGQCYPDSLKHWIRGVALRGNDRIVIQDELEPLGTQHVVWHFHTRAAVKITGNTAELSQAGATVRLQITSPASAAFSLVDASAPPQPNAANPGLSDVQIDLPALSQPTTITVELSQGSAMAAPLKVTPIDSWREP